MSSSSRPLAACTARRNPARRRRSGQGHAVQGRGTEGPRRPARTASSRPTRGPPRGWGPAPRRILGPGSQPAMEPPAHPTSPRPRLSVGSAPRLGLGYYSRPRCAFPAPHAGAGLANGDWRQVLAVTFIRFAFPARPVPAKPNLRPPARMRSHGRSIISHSFASFSHPPVNLISLSS